jgi:myosin heavy subunit
VFRREGVEVLMADLQVSTEEFAYGNSKIFIRNPRTVKQRKRPMNNDRALFRFPCT